MDRLEGRYVYEEITRPQYDKCKKKLEVEMRDFESTKLNFKFNSSILKKAVVKATD